MKTNWDKTDHNNKTAISNYYGDCCMAQITLSEAYTGVLGRWWAPVRHKDLFARKVLLEFNRSIPSARVVVSFPLPDIEGVKPLFEDYEFFRTASIV
jgi:hypothetical protein